MCHVDVCHLSLSLVVKVRSWCGQLGRRQSNCRGGVVASTICVCGPVQLYKKNDSDETRTHNLLIRSQTPYPLGHRAENTTGRESDIIYTRVFDTVGGLGLSQSTAVSITCIIMTSWVCSKCPVARVHEADTRALTS